MNSEYRLLLSVRPGLSVEENREPTVNPSRTASGLKRRAPSSIERKKALPGDLPALDPGEVAEPSRH